MLHTMAQKSSSSKKAGVSEPGQFQLIVGDLMSTVEGRIP